MKVQYKKLAVVVSLALIFFLSFSPSGFAQQSWSYSRAITFPAADSAHVRPYGITVDSKGDIWVISSDATDTSAHNSVWEAAPSDTVFKKIVDFGNYYDPSAKSYFDKHVGTLNGISALGLNIYLSGTQPYQLTSPNTVSFIYILRNGSLSDSLHLGYGMRGSGFGTYLNCIEVDPDTLAFTASPYDPNHVGPSWRAFNLGSEPIVAYDKAGTPSTRPFGSYLLGDPSYAYSAYYSPEPGGPMGQSANDEIRSLALVPEMNYSDSASAIKNSYFYTSRSSSVDNPTSGGIAVWKGGYDRQPALYTAKRVTDISGDLTLGTYTYYGIAADSAGDLFVCRPDSGHEWVKIFKLNGTFATQTGSLPSRTDPSNPSASGAPFEGPTAIALSPSENSAYVADRVAREVFVFQKNVTAVNENGPVHPHKFALQQNYPDPFNPATVISYQLGNAGTIRLDVFNVLGQKVATLVNGFESAGTHSVIFNGDRLPSGVYFYSLSDGGRRIVKKMILMK